MNTVTAIDRTVLWLSRLLGMLNMPIAFIAIIDGSLLFTLLNPSYIPKTTEQWIGFFTAISAVAGTIAGLTIRSSHSPNRKIAHLLIAAFGLMLTFGSLMRLVRTIFAGWLP